MKVANVDCMDSFQTKTLNKGKERIHLELFTHV